jgi:hypothetical protein
MTTKKVLLFSFFFFFFFFFFFYFFHKRKKRKRKAFSQSVPRSTMSTPPPPALGGVWVGNQDAQCRLQEGNDVAAPTAPSPDLVKRKGFSPASLSPSSKTRPTPPHDHRHGHHHGATCTSSHRETVADRATKAPPAHHCTPPRPERAAASGAIATATAVATSGARTKATRAQLRPSTGRNRTRPTGSRRHLHGRRPTVGHKHSREHLRPPGRRCR